MIFRAKRADTRALWFGWRDAGLLIEHEQLAETEQLA